MKAVVDKSGAEEGIGMANVLGSKRERETSDSVFAGKETLKRTKAKQSKLTKSAIITTILVKLVYA